MSQSVLIFNSLVGWQIFAVRTTCLAAAPSLSGSPKPGSRLHRVSRCSLAALLHCADLAGAIGLANAAVSESLLPIYQYRAQDLKKLRGHFARPPREAGPWIYWMWFDNVVSKDEIKRELTEIAEAGFGGVELRCLSFYGWSGTPPVPSDDAVLRQLGHRRLKYLSNEFLDVLEFTCAAAERLGLRFSINMGMGWPPGGPWIPEGYRSKHLSWTTNTDEHRFKGKVAKWVLPSPKASRKSDAPRVHSRARFLPFYLCPSASIWVSIEWLRLKAQPASLGSGNGNRSVVQTLRIALTARYAFFASEQCFDTIGLPDLTR